MIDFFKAFGMDDNDKKKKGKKKKLKIEFGYVETGCAGGGLSSFEVSDIQLKKINFFKKKVVFDSFKQTGKNLF